MTFAYISVYLKAQQQLKVLASGNLLVKTRSSGASKCDARNASSKSGNKKTEIVDPPVDETVSTLRVHRGGGAAMAKWNAYDTNNGICPYSTGSLRSSSRVASSRRGNTGITAGSYRSPTRSCEKENTNRNISCRGPTSRNSCTYRSRSFHYSGTPVINSSELGAKSGATRLGAFLRERKATKTLGIVFGVFILCWLPFFTLNVIQAFTNRSFQYEIQLFEFFTLLGYANSCLNPLIYAATNDRFRSAFLRILRCKKQRNERDTVFALATMAANTHH